MNIEEKALSMFRAEPYRYNCAQTVCAALERMDLVEPLSACSGGRAPDGLCGALYGALQCSPEECRADIMARFVDRLGYSRCRELKRRAKSLAVNVFLQPFPWPPGQRRERTMTHVL